MTDDMFNNVSNISDIDLYTIEFHDYYHAFWAIPIGLICLSIAITYLYRYLKIDNVQINGDISSTNEMANSRQSSIINIPKLPILCKD